MNYVFSLVGPSALVNEILVEFDSVVLQLYKNYQTDLYH